MVQMLKLPHRRQFLHLAASALALPAVSPEAWAQDYPARPITIVVPFAAGGPTDTLARILAERLTASLKQTVVIENTVGAAGTIGVNRVARALPDGYTVSIGHLGTHVINGAIYPLQYDLVTDFEPVGLIADHPSIVVSKNAVPAKDLQELIVWVKSNGASVGTSGVGAVTQVAGIQFQNLTGAQLHYVPYRGAGPALQDLVAGQIDLMFDQASNSLPHIRGNRIRAYAVMDKRRLAAAPDIPTADEAGMPNFYISVWHALWVPKGTPKAVVARLNAALVETLDDANVRARLADLGQQIWPRDQQTPEALLAFHQSEIAKWWPIVKAANIKGE
jgi:tripartite-type tricarboxylate transporter receptor subunit TctC